jgi:hypothetical protein
VTASACTSSTTTVTIDHVPAFLGQTALVSLLMTDSLIPRSKNSRGYAGHLEILEGCLDG